jgi:TrpR-related protein YerC/YecD
MFPETPFLKTATLPGNKQFDFTPVWPPNIPMATAKDAKNHQKALFEAISTLDSPEETRRFLTDLCTPKELKELSERWVIARMLDEGQLSYREISAETGASTTTVGRVARFLQQEPHKGYRLILDRVKGRK